MCRPRPPRSAAFMEVVRPDGLVIRSRQAHHSHCRSCPNCAARAADAACVCTAASRSASCERSRSHAVCRFTHCDLDSVAVTINPVGTCTKRSDELVLFRAWPPGPDALNTVSITSSGRIDTTTSTHWSARITVTVDVCLRVSPAGTRWIRCTPTNTSKTDRRLHRTRTTGLHGATSERLAERLTEFGGERCCVTTALPCVDLIPIAHLWPSCVVPPETGDGVR